MGKTLGAKSNGFQGKFMNSEEILRVGLPFTSWPALSLCPCPLLWSTRPQWSMTAKDLQWSSLDPLLWHHGETVSENCLSPWAALHVEFTNGQEIEALHCLWETCLHFNLNLQRYVALASRSLLPVGTALLCELGISCACVSAMRDLSSLQTSRGGDAACEEVACRRLGSASLGTRATTTS